MISGTVSTWLMDIFQSISSLHNEDNVLIQECVQRMVWDLMSILEYTHKGWVVNAICDFMCGPSYSPLPGLRIQSGDDIFRRIRLVE